MHRGRACSYRRTLVCLDMYPTGALDMAYPGWDPFWGWEHCCLHLCVKLLSAQLWHLRCECAGWKLDREIDYWRNVAVGWIGDVCEAESPLGRNSPWTGSGGYHTDSGRFLQVWA